MSVRRVVPADAEFINAHWRDVTDEDLIRLGELGRPDPIANIEFINWFCNTPNAPILAAEDLRIWCADGVAIGYSTLKDFTEKGTVQIHLHLTRPYWRMGFGSVLFCMSALEFIFAFKLERLYCQPKSDNAMPNGMLSKIGFKAVGAVECQRSNGSSILQTRYLIDIETAKCFLNATNAPGTTTIAR